MLSDQARKALYELGLTAYEVKVYETLISYGYLTANELSQISKIPYTKVYEVLTSLFKKGFIKIEKARPAKYYPIEPKIVLDYLKKENEKKLIQNVEIALSELNAIYERKGIKEKSDVWLIRGRNDIIAKIKEMVIICKHELFLSLPKYYPELKQIIPDLFTSIRFQNIKIYALISKDVSDTIFRFSNFNIEVRVAKKMFGGGLIVDSKEVLLLLSEEDGDFIALWSDHEGLAKFAKNYFLYVWESAKPV
jgi:sugar-specific transcriptional regulator TrmB